MKFVCFLWRGKGFDRPVAKYDERHVSTLARMLRHNGKHDLICVDDGSFPEVPGVLYVRMPQSLLDMRSYLPKSWAFSPEFHEIVGERFASIDLDVVITGDLAPLLTSPFRIWDAAKAEPYNTSLFVLEPGKHTKVWTSLTPDRLREARNGYPYWTGDQSWLAYVLGPGQPTFGEADGVIRYRPKRHRVAPVKGALAHFFCGPFCPRTESEFSPWVKQAWQ